MLCLCCGQACADKLAREMALYGYPPQFPAPEEEESAAAVASLAIKDASSGNPAEGAQQETDPAKFKGKKVQSAH